MRDDIKLTGNKLIESIPESNMKQIRESFADWGLDFDQDIKDCTLIVSSIETCFLKYKHEDDLFEKGKLIAAFNLDGSGFFYTHGSRTEDNIEIRRKEGNRI